MNLRQLKYFVTLAETLSFTKTAQVFYISQTAVTQQIKSLESQLGVPLFRRTKRKVELTSAGAVFLPEAREILEKTQKAIVKTKLAYTGSSDTLRIGVVQGYEHSDMPEALHRFRAQNPNISISIFRSDASDLYCAPRNTTGCSFQFSDSPWQSGRFQHLQPYISHLPFDGISTPVSSFGSQKGVQPIRFKS